MNRWRKTGIIVVLVLSLVLILPLAVACGGPDTSTPEGTVECFLNAVEDLDADAAADCCIESQRSDTHDMIEAMADLCNSVSFSNLDMTVTSQSNTEAEVTASYDYEVEYKDGNTESGHYNAGHFILTKVDDKWLISG